MEGVADDVRLELGVILAVMEPEGVLDAVPERVLVLLAVCPLLMVLVAVPVPVTLLLGVPVPVEDCDAVPEGLGVPLWLGVCVGLGLGSNSVTG